MQFFLLEIKIRLILYAVAKLHFYFEKSKFFGYIFYKYMLYFIK